ncbi:MAG: hypothetical protein JSR82_23505 [Verrucomicrobia bacterium]|nr:hypothetical protein [Verrucomicrobiota bacterium]
MPDSSDKAKDSSKPAASETGAKRIAVAPRQNAASGDREAPPAAAPVDPSSLGQQIAVALMQVLGGSGAAAPATPPANERNLIAREEKRFRRGAQGEEGEPEGPMAPPAKLVEKRSRQRGDAPASAEAEGEAKPSSPAAPTAKASTAGESSATAEAKSGAKEESSTPNAPSTAAAASPAEKREPTGKSEKTEKSEPTEKSETSAGEDETAPARPARPAPERSELEQAELDNERGYFDRGSTAPRADAPSMKTVWRRLPPGQRQAILTGGGLLVLGLGFFLGRLTAPEGYSGAPTLPGDKPQQAPLADAPTIEPLRLAEPAELKRIDEAAILQSAGNFAKAEEMLLQLAKDAPGVKGTQLTLALLNLQRGQMAQADYHISLGLSQGEEPGRLHGLRALVRARTGRPKLANESFELAQRAAPYEWKYFFLHGEALRRFGKLQQALDKYDQALARVHEQSEDEMMLYKRRLTLVALGRGEELDAEIRKQLEAPIPNIDWLMIALAREAQRGDFVAAAKPLKRASETASRDLLSEKLRDFYLYQFCYEKELEPYFRPIMAQLRSAAEAAPVTESEKPDAPAQGPASMGGIPTTIEVPETKEAKETKEKTP